ncbi:MAG: hypothetical protein HGB29_09385 [Chlorobiaceae bacterium]|nr:hypothetical protein [Chlorobiaceae bacterium]NTW75063.1 hypothetical protein [Chlorobiaceae bacterium]
MKVRKISGLRNVLRIFEIALFFAVAVLGYGLLAKTSSTGSKSRSRSVPTGIEKNLTCGAQNRELPRLSPMGHPQAVARPAFDAVKKFRLITSQQAQFSGFHPALHVTQSDAGIPQQFDYTSFSAPLPCNLLQQNPVLLI